MLNRGDWPQQPQTLQPSRLCFSTVFVACTRCTAGALLPQCLRQFAKERTQERQTDRSTPSAQTVRREARTNRLHLQGPQHLGTNHPERVQVWSHGTLAEVAPSHSVCNRRTLSRTHSTLHDNACHCVLWQRQHHLLKACRNHGQHGCTPKNRQPLDIGPDLLSLENVWHALGPLGSWIEAYGLHRRCKQAFCESANLGTAMQVQRGRSVFAWASRTGVINQHIVWAHELGFECCRYGSYHLCLASTSSPSGRLVK